MYKPPHDRFYGGPLDGQEQPITPELTTSRYDPATGALYVRNMSRDTTEARVWEHAAERTPLDSIAVTRQVGKNAVTLQQLDNLVEAAKQHGYPPDTETAVTVTIKGHLKSIGFNKPPTF